MSLKRLALAAFALATVAFATPGCAQIGHAVPAIGNSAIRHSVVDDKAWAATLSVYVATTEAYTVAVKNGLIPKEAVAKIAPLRRQAVSIRKAGQDAYELGNATNLAAQVTALRDIVAKLRPLIPGAPQLPALK